MVMARCLIRKFSGDPSSPYRLMKSLRSPELVSISLSTCSSLLPNECPKTKRSFPTDRRLRNALCRYPLWPIFASLLALSPSATNRGYKDESMEDAENLPPPDVLAAEIVDQLEAALEEFRGIEKALGVE